MQERREDERVCYLSGDCWQHVCRAVVEGA